MVRRPCVRQTCNAEMGVWMRVKCVTMEREMVSTVSAHAPVKLQKERAVMDLSERERCVTTAHQLDGRSTVRRLG